MSKARVFGDNFRGEKSFTLKGDDNRVAVHPWDRPDWGIQGRSVYVDVGDLNKRGGSKSEDHFNVIVDRDEFVNGLLAVFPELRRAEA